MISYRSVKIRTLEDPHVISVLCLCAYWGRVIYERNFKFLE